MARYDKPEWAEGARAMQEPMCQLLSNRDWECIPKGQRWKLERKVGFWLYNLPTLKCGPDNKQLGYSKEQVENIVRLCDLMLKDINMNTSNVHFGVVFIVVGYDKKKIVEEQEKLFKEAQELSTRELENLRRRKQLWKDEQEQKEKLEKMEDTTDNEKDRQTLNKKIANIHKEQMYNQSEHARIQRDKETLSTARNFDAQAIDQDQMLPLFKCKAAGARSSPYVVVDSWHGRRYESWEHFIETEELPAMCRYCVPTGGVYKRDKQGNVQLECRKPRANSVATKLLKAADVLVPIAELAVVGMTVVVPLVGFGVLGAVSLGAKSYQVTRSGFALNNLKSHGQDISFENKNARGHWVTIGCSTFGLFTPRTISGIIERAATLSRIDFLLEAISGALLVGGSFTLQALSIVNHIATIMVSFRGRNLNPFDFEKLEFIFLAYVNVSINYGLEPEVVFEKARTDFLNSTRAGHRLRFINDMTDAGSIPGFFASRMDEAKVPVQEAKDFTIANTLNVIQALTLNFDHQLVSADLSKYFTEDGQLILDLSGFPARIKWMKVDEQSRLDVYHSTERLAKASESAITSKAKEEHKVNLRALLETFKISFKVMHQSVIEILCSRYSEVLGVSISNLEEILVYGKPIFARLSGHQKTRLALAQVCQDPMDKDKIDMLRLVHEFAEHMKCRTFRMYLEYAEYIAITFYQKRNEMLNKIRQNMLNRQSQVRKNIGGHGRAEASKPKGLLIDQAHALAVQFFEGGHQLDSLRDDFNAFNEAQMLNSKVPPIGSLETDEGDLAAYHYHKHKYFEFHGDSRLQILEDYIQLIETVFGRAVNRANVVKVDSDAENRSRGTLVTYKCPKQGVVAVVVNKYFGEDGNTSGIITCMSYSSPPL